MPFSICVSERHPTKAHEKALLIHWADLKRCHLKTSTVTFGRISRKLSLSAFIIGIRPRNNSLKLRRSSSDQPVTNTMRRSMCHIMFVSGADYFWNMNMMRLAVVVPQVDFLLLMMNQFVGRDQIDWIVLGLSILLNWCFQVLQSLGKPLEAQ